jgi:phosphoserine phosphatase RsbX
MGALTGHGVVDFSGESISLVWAAASRSKIEGVQSGDGYLVRRIGSSVILAVADGAGSGGEAAHATDICLRALSGTASADLNTLFAEAHRACKHTRGAALGIALIDVSTRQMNWAAVGEVDGLLLRRLASASDRRPAIIQRGGTLGHHLPKVISHPDVIETGDTIIMTTDGIRSAFRADIVSEKGVEALADHILQVHGRNNDDSLVLVAKVGAPS